MNRLTSFFLLLTLFLGACGPTTRPSDLLNPAEATAVGAGSTAPPGGALTAGTPVVLPMVIRGTEGSPTPLPTLPPTQAVTSTSLPTATTEVPLRFAVIGDYGSGNQNEANVAGLVNSWSPEFVITVGDNNYPSGQPETIDANVGQFYHSYIEPYTGGYGEGADQNRFFPTLGNHDYDTNMAQSYFDYFALPGNERYYDFTWGPVHFFALNSDPREPDGVASNSTQAAWLQSVMAQSQAPWQVVYFHAAPYSSGLHGSTDWMRWPFLEWGADAVLAGHDHDYERLSIGGLPYIVNGLGGGAIYPVGDPIDGSQVRYSGDHGAMLVEATPTSLTFQFASYDGQVIDSFVVEK
jgi:hypothetical protein